MNELPNAFGFLDAVEETESGLRIHGWMLRDDGPFDGFELRSSGLAERGFEPIVRPDVAGRNAWIPGAERAGFRLDCVPVGEAQDAAEFTIVGMRNGKPVAKIDGGYHRLRQVKEMPPAHLIQRVTGVASASAFHASGLKAYYDFWNSLRRHGALTPTARIFDWGCGSGRLTMHLVERLPEAEIHGSDIDGEAVQWATAAIAGAAFRQTGLHPPLPYDDDFFDVVIATSVFTHLTRPDQQAWLQEIRRILRPGGRLLATTQGPFFARYYRPGPDVLDALERSGFWDSPLDDLKGVAPDGYYRSTYQTREYTHRTWSKVLPIIDYIEAGNLNRQDLYLLQKPAH